MAGTNDPNAAIEATLDRANLLFTSGLGNTTAILKEADQLLSEKLHAQIAKTKGPDIRFTEAHALLWRKQIQITQAYLDKRLAGHTHEQARKAIELSVKDTVKLAKKLEKRFTGIVQPLQLEQQGMQDQIVRGTGASLLRQQATSVARYSTKMIGEFERVMRVGFVSGLSQHQVISRMVDAGELGGISAAGLHAQEPAWFPAPTGYVKKRYWAERIVRTESAYAYNAAGLRTIQTAKVVDFPDMQKKILAHFDIRTAPDSIAVHGQVRPVDGLFKDGAGREYLHPPARPNDRETVIPWRPHWHDLPATAPAPPAEQAAAAVAAAPPVTSAPPDTKQNAKAKVKKMIAKAKAELEAKKPSNDLAFELAKQKAIAAQLEGKKMLAQATAATPASKVKKKTEPANIAELKAKAEAYLETKKAAVEKRKLEIAARRAKQLETKTTNWLEYLTEDSKETTPKQKLADLKDLAKKDPDVFAKLYSKATGKQLASKPSPQSAGKMALTIGKKLAPDLDWPLPKGKPKAPAVDAELEGLKTLFGQDGGPAGMGIKLAKPETVAKLFAEQGFELKPEGGGSAYINVFKGGTKVTYFTKVDGGFKVAPPPSVNLPVETFATQEAAALYGAKVSEAIKKAATAAPAKAVSAAKAPAFAPGEMRWSKKWKAPARQKLDLDNPARRIDLGLAQDSRHGISIAADGDWIEDFQVYFTTEISEGERTTVARFKVNEYRQAEFREKIVKLKGRDETFPGFQRLKSLDAKGLELTRQGTAMAANAPGVVMKRAAVQGAEVRFFYTDAADHPALKNVVEVRFPEPTQPGGRYDKFKQVTDALGVAAAPPKPKDLKTFRRAKVMNAIDTQASLELANAVHRDSKKVDEIWQQAVKRRPWIEEIEKDAELRELVDGQFALYSDKLAERWKKAGVTHLSHSISGGTDAIKQMLISDPSAGLLSSRERYNRGLHFTGMSTSTDFETGGADSVFTRLRSSTSSHGGFEIDPSELGRLDLYAFNADRYGRAGKNNMHQRVTVVDAERLGGQFDTSNEVMFRRSVPTASLRRLIVSSLTRRELLQEFEKAGITEINGIPVAEFVTE